MASQPIDVEAARGRGAGAFAAGAGMGAIIALAAFALGSVFALSVAGATQRPVVLSAPSLAAQDNTQPQPTVLPDVPVADTIAGAPDFARWGSANAPVKIVVFADPQCPYCKQSAAGNEQTLIHDYVETGQASLTYRHFDFLGPDSNALSAAMECAGRQGAFWRMHSLIFGDATQDLAGLARGEPGDAIQAALRGAGVDLGTFAACLKDGSVKARVDADTSTGRALNVMGTPTIFVNGRRIVGAVPYDMLKSAVDFALSERR